MLLDEPPSGMFWTATVAPWVSTVSGSPPVGGSAELSPMTQIKDGIGDVELDGRRLAFEL